MEVRSILPAVFLVAAAAVCALPQNEQTPPTAAAQRREAASDELKGMPPRAAPTDYQAQAAAGSLTIAAEFSGHSVPTPDGTYSTEDFVVVEAAVFGPPGARATLSIADFS